MVTAEERIKILRMLQEGRISPEAAAELLQAMETGVPTPAAAPSIPEIPPAPEVPEVMEGEGQRPRWLRVRVTDTDSGRPRVNVRMPLGLVNLGLKLGQRFTPEIDGVNLDELVHAAQSNGTGPIVDVYDEEDGEHVEVFLE